MPYKIVQTKERNREMLVIVPSLWEENGNLWWPPKNSQYKILLKDELSIPDKKQWKLMSCALKRKNIRTYDLAEAELSIMEENSDTDVNDMPMTGTVVPRSTIVVENQVMEYELMANKLICDEGNKGKPYTDNGNVTATESITNQENIVEIISTETLQLDQILENQKMLSEKIDKILQIQAITLENQQKIVQKLATQSVHLEEMSVQLADMKEGPSVTLLKDANPVDTESFTLKPIENQRDLIYLDQFLADKEQKNKLQKQLSFLFSASSGQGKTCAYKLQDILFTRDFLCNCSWAGGSRGERSKIALKDYRNVLKFFHSMIRKWDPTYTVQDNETFFKIITKNSKQRKTMKNLRMSSKRCRKNKGNSGKEKNTGNEIQLNDDKDKNENISLDNNMSDADDDTEGGLC